MRLSGTTIATAVFATLLVPGFSIGAYGAAKPAVSADKAADTNAMPSAEPAAPMPAAAREESMPEPGGQRHATPPAELFVGYSYLRAMPTIAADNRMGWLNGGSASIALNVGQYLGLVADFGGFDDSKIRLLGTGGSPSIDADSSGTAYTYLFGPRLSLRGHERFTPFVQALFGGIHASEVTMSTGCTGVGCRVLPAENSFAVAAGGGLDFRVHHHFAIRIIQAEYLMTQFVDRTQGSRGLQNDMRLSAGVVFRFGGHRAEIAPPAAITYSCSVNPSAVYAGEAIAASGTAVNLDPAKTAVYTWSVDGGTVNGTSSTAKIDTTGLAPASYTLKGHVSEGDRAGENADCTAPFAVRAIAPPTVSCSANPSSVISGDSSAITAAGMSPDNRALTYSYSASSGTVSGSGSTATLSTVGATLGTVIVTCNVVDDKGQSASGTTSVAVSVPVVAPKPMTSALCPVQFERDARRPARVDNEAKACLDEIALNLQRNSDAKIALVGNASNGEKGGKKLASERAVNTKAYLVSEKGIDASRITVYSGTQDAKTVSTTLIPSGATLDASGDTPVN